MNASRCRAAVVIAAGIALYGATKEDVVDDEHSDQCPNATLVEDDIEAVIRGLKAQLAGEIEVGGPDLARSLTNLGLIDEYQLYFHPVVFGRGKPFFAGPRTPLRLVASDRIGEDAIRLTYVPA
jgi:dihydrofolate reductase